MTTDSEEESGPTYKKYALVETATGRVFMSGHTMDIASVPSRPGYTLVELDLAGVTPVPDLHAVNIETLEITECSPAIGVIRDRKLDELRAANNAAIRRGFVSGALGSDHHYPADDIDQANMQRVAIAGGALWCLASDVWSFEAHTSAQGAQVLSDFGAACDSARAHFADLVAQVNAADTADAIAAIAW